MYEVEELERFIWDHLWSEIETQCPVLLFILKDSLPKSAMKKNSVIPSLRVCQYTTETMYLTYECCLANDY